MKVANKSNYVIGMDFGTDSVRALLVDAVTGKEITDAVHLYTRWNAGLYCNAFRSQFRQHPLDYLEAMEYCISDLLKGLSKDEVSQISALSIATTGSTPVAVDKEGTPLALLPEFEENPNAMFILWKDHSATAEAEEINQLARKWEIDYTKYSGGLYSSEWFWAKILYILRTDKQVASRAYSWVEHSDWMPAVLTGNTDPLSIKRSRCSAGHKAMWHEEFAGLPSSDFLNTLDSTLSDIRDRLYCQTHTADKSAGTISAEWANRLGLPIDLIIGVGAIDAHMGAVGAAIKPYTLVKVMGTSTCDMLTIPEEKHDKQLVKGICGQVNGSIIPGMIGMEAGQSAFGDLYNWFIQLLSFPLKHLSTKNGMENQKRLLDSMLIELNTEALQIPVSIMDEIALDWINGRRTPDVNAKLTGWITGLRLGSDAPRLFKALVEATAFGSKAIVDRFEKEGIAVKEVLATGGISKKSPFVMQTLANVLNRTIRVVRSDQTCALGAAMFAATACGLYDNINDAQEAMASGFELTYHPDKTKVAVYEKLYDKYLLLGKLQESNFVD
jgi:L-ribulokinase